MKRFVKAGKELKNPNFHRFVFNVRQDADALVDRLRALQADASTSFEELTLAKAEDKIQEAIRILESI